MMRKTVRKDLAFAALLWIAGLFVSSCATSPLSPHTPAAEPVRQAPALPKAMLTQEVLYNVLVGELAGRHGEYGLSVRSLALAARETGDPRLAERATRAAIFSKRYADGLETGKMWVRLRPDNRDAHESLAVVLLETGDHAGATVEMEKMLDLAKRDNRLGHAYLRIASVLVRQNNRSSAVKIMTVLTQKNAGNAEAQFALAHLAMRATNLTLASASIDRALIIRKGWQDAALMKARILAATDNHDRTIRFYREYLGKYPRLAKLRMNFARYLIDRKRWNEAREQFVVVLRGRPKDIDVLYALGLLSLQTNHLEDADTFFRTAIDIDPTNDQVRMYLAQTAERRERYDLAASWYKSVSSKKHEFEAQTRYAVVIAKQGNLKQGRAILAGISASNDSERVQLALAEEQMLRESGHYGAALKVLSQALESLPRHKDLLYARALIAEKLDDLTLHERDLRLVLKADPKNAHALNALGYTLADRTDRHQEAYRLIKEALDLRPDDPFILDSMGWVQYRLGNRSEAIRYLKRALAIRYDAEISAHLGEVLWVSGKQRQAKRVWDEALQRAPNNESVRKTINKFKQ